MGVISEWDKAADMELLGATQANAKDYTDTQVSGLSGVMDEINAKIDEVKVITEQAKNAAQQAFAKKIIQPVKYSGTYQYTAFDLNCSRTIYTNTPLPYAICSLSNVYFNQRIIQQSGAPDVLEIIVNPKFKTETGQVNVGVQFTVGVVNIWLSVTKLTQGQSNVQYVPLPKNTYLENVKVEVYQLSGAINFESITVTVKTYCAMYFEMS